MKDGLVLNAVALSKRNVNHGTSIARIAAVITEVIRMTNADKFKHLFGIYATELWAMPESDFLEWLNADAQDMPTVERKTGKWIDAVVAGELPVIFCDQCNTFLPLQFGASHNFCPNCGADMRGESDDIPNEYFESGGK